MKARSIALLSLVSACGADSSGLPGGQSPTDLGPVASRDTGPASDAGGSGTDGGQADMGTAGGCAAEPMEAADAVRRVAQGWVRGVVDGAVVRWLGIPYAKPPVGDRRWRPPEAPACFGEIFAADTWPSACPQIEQGQTVPFSPDNPILGDEDCLKLNVFAPRGLGPEDRRPVMVFIHGGGNQVGSAGERTASGARLYDGAGLARAHGVVVVTMQYRLGPLGFLALPALASEGRGVGNQGLLDQQFALQWVQRHIERFGGDPDRVLLFGESAGAVNTCAQIASPGAAGLFQRAIIQSGSCRSARALETKLEEGGRFVAETPCAEVGDPVSCLRELDVETLLRSGSVPITVGPSPPADFAWGPVIDGEVLPERPLDRIAGGRHAKVPLIVGANADETALSTPPVADEAELRRQLSAFGGPNFVDAVLQLYPVDAFDSPRDALVQIFSDATFVCGSRVIARAAVRGGSEPVHRYLFAQSLDRTAFERSLGAFHGVELGFLFGTLGGGRPLTATEATTVELIQRLWTDFAAHGALEEGEWPPYRSDEPLLRIEAEPSVSTQWRDAQCDFWDMISGADVPPPGD
jgi:para-nitrobenzyl esterase